MSHEAICAYLELQRRAGEQDPRFTEDDKDFLLNWAHLASATAAVFFIPEYIQLMTNKQLFDVLPNFSDSRYIEKVQVSY